jgi:hypothetical protein
MAKTNLNLSCRFDQCIYTDDTCLIQNYKTGWREPEKVKLNAQMKVEAMLVALKISVLKGSRIKRFIVQLVTIPFGVMEAEFTWTELAGLYDDITGTLASLESTTAELHASPDACRHCSAILICQAHKDLLKPTLTLLRTSPVSDDPVRLAEALDAIAIIRGYFDEFENYCKAGLTAEPPKPRLTIKDYAMVPGAEKRDWSNLEAARTALMESGVQAEKMDKLKSHTVAGYQKLYAEHFKRKPEDIKEAFHKLMDGCITVTTNKPSLKRVKGESRLKEIV